MYDFIRGKLDHKTLDALIVDNQGIGYKLLVSNRTLESAGSAGDDIKVYVQLNVKEDDMSLFGFLTVEEREMFNKITGVSGIGPKIALAILSAMSTADLAIALVTEDVKAITRVKGIGQKTAKRMILELKEKVDNDELQSAMMPDLPVQADMTHEAVQALMALGFSSVEASKAVRSVQDTPDSVEQLITAALRTRGA